jgi:hypothetical protein
MLVKYQNEIYRRKERLGVNFCYKCPLNTFDQKPCYIEKTPYTCLVTGDITLSNSEIFDL